MSINPLRNFVRSDFSGGDLSNLNLQRASFIGIKLIGTNFSRTILDDADLSGADLTGADLSGARLIGTKFSGSNLSQANLSGCILAGDLQGANLSSADLSNSVLYFRADMNIYSNLHNVNLSGTNFEGCTRPSDETAIPTRVPTNQAVPDCCVKTQLLRAQDLKRWSGPENLKRAVNLPE